MSGTCPQVVDFGVDAAFSLVSPTPYGVGPWRLERVDLDRATTESGPTFPVAALAVASGYIWIACGRTTETAIEPSLCQVDPRTLAVVRQIQLPPTGAQIPDAYPTAIADGPFNTVWAGYDQTLVRIGTQDGAILSALRIASGTVDNLSVDPSQLHLYVSLSHPTVSGKAVDASVLEFAAGTGRALAETPADSPVTGSVAGGALTAVPGGVWVSFRGGMAGETILLRQSDLAMIGPSSAQMNVPFPDSVFHWMMGASTVYGRVDGRATLVVVNEAGLLACIDPQSSVVRVQGDLTRTRGATELLAVDGGSARVLVTDAAGLESVTPPPACWG